MGRFKKFLYAYFSVILGLVVLSMLGNKILGGKLSPIEYFFSEPYVFWCSTLAVFVASLFL